MSETSPGQSPTKHWGTFECASVTRRFHPYPIAGRGSLDISSKGLAFRAYRAGGGALRTLAGCAIVFGCLVGGPALAVMFFGTGDSTEPNGALMAIVVTVFFLAVTWVGRWKRKAKVGKPLTARVPWSQIWRVEAGGSALTRRRRARRGQPLFAAAEVSGKLGGTGSHIRRTTAHVAAEQLHAELEAASTDVVFVVGRLGSRKELRFSPSLPSEPGAVLAQLAELTKP